MKIVRKKIKTNKACWEIKVLCAVVAVQHFVNMRVFFPPLEYLMRRIEKKS